MLTFDPILMGVKKSFKSYNCTEISAWQYLLQTNYAITLLFLVNKLYAPNNTAPKMNVAIMLFA